MSCIELVQIPVIPEDIYFTNEFTKVAELEEGNTSAAGLVRELLLRFSVPA